MSVYVIGAGAIGTLVSSSLTKSLKVNFIVRNANKLTNLAKSNNCFTIKRLYDNEKIMHYKINNAFTVDQIPDSNIDFLLICVKTFDTIKSLTPILDKINNKTRILLIQNGMGVVDELYSTLWKKNEDRPTIYQGVISHGIWQAPEDANTYNYNHAGFGDLKICEIPRDLKHITDNKIIEKDEIIKQLIESDLNVKKYSYDELLVYQIQKFLVNCCMNCTTSIIDTINYKLNNSKEVDELYTSIVSESLAVLRKAYPILQTSELAKKLLNTEKQIGFVKHVGFSINGKNSTSMRQDVLNLRDTEIDYINGHIIKKAFEEGMSAPVSETICNLVKIKLLVNRRTAEEEKK
ncbi:2-dehydropantoate 2-reductase (Ketopantoate reductase) (KPA reductase) (KPR) [Pichia californica]|nr:2-dehydropantoate 2-reductase (Ketopantoate reductase) (KPA reductase) (KPR) [[Candida] californica]